MELGSPGSESESELLHRNKQKPRLFQWVGALHFLLHKVLALTLNLTLTFPVSPVAGGRELRQGGDVEVEVPEVGLSEAGAVTVGGDGTGTGADAIGVMRLRLSTAAVVVAALVAAEGLAGGKALEADGALVGPSTSTHRRRIISGTGGGPRVGGRGLAVAGLMAAKRLVGREGLITNSTSISSRRRRGREKICSGGIRRCSAAGEHDEAEGEVLFFGGGVGGIETGSFGAFPFGPGLHRIEVLVAVAEEGGGGGGIESFQSHGGGGELGIGNGLREKWESEEIIKRERGGEVAELVGEVKSVN